MEERHYITDLRYNYVSETVSGEYTKRYETIDKDRKRQEERQLGWEIWFPPSENWCPI